MAGSFGGSIKLTGESEYTKALKTITSNLTVMASEMKLVSSEYSKNDKSVQAITSRNSTLGKEIEEVKKKVDVYSSALADFNKQQDKNASSMMEMMMNLEKEKAKLEEMKSSTTATSKEIEAQEKVVADLSTELASNQAQYDKNKLVINKYQAQLNDSKAELNNLNSQLEENNASLNKNKDAFTTLSEKIDNQREHLEELKKSYASAVLEQGKNSKEAKGLATEIKTLSNDLKDNESKLEGSTKAVEKFTSSEKEAGTQTLKLGDLIKGNLISEGIVAGIKGLASAMGTMVSGIVNLGKQAIQNFAEYEQLIGGVETLFKESAGVVSEYANNAYKTAGLSANEYMSTVTSFSASLLQSLNGDTAKSAEVADMAITDMSDNANKMGTSMSMIQSAYQGFAKQNYTMLDNLKLGYGGTKTEMERLLADATKISGVKYDISSLNDVYQAIHVIQGELGITGTTAKEASTTIQGSVNSMKSAWTNLVTGIADDNADFDTLIQNFVDSIMTMAENIVPRISIALDGIVDLILGLSESLLPQLLEMGVELIQNLITGITGNIGSLMTSLNQVINTILTALVQMLPQIIQVGIQVIVSLIQGIGQSLPTLIPQIVEAVILIVETLIDNIDLIIDAGIQLIIGLAEGIINALPQLIEKIPILIDKLIQAIIDNLPKIIEMGIELVIQLAVGLIKAIPELLKAIPQIITSLLNGIKNSFTKMVDIGKDLLNKVKEGISSGISKIADVGKNLVQGLWNGINNAKDWVLDKIKGFGKSVLNGIKSFFGIHSPSTLFRDEIGSNLALGIGEGFEDEMNDVANQMENAIPTDFDVGVNTNYDSMGNYEGSSYNKDLLVTAFREALDGMSFKAFDEKFGELVIDNVEKVVYS